MYTDNNLNLCRLYNKATMAEVVYSSRDNTVSLNRGPTIYLTEKVRQYMLSVLTDILRRQSYERC